MCVTIQILNTELDTLETRKIRCHILGFQTTGCVKNANSTHKRNVFYPSKSMFKFSMLFYFCLMKRIYCQQKCIYQLLIVCRVLPKRSIKLSKFSSWVPLIYQFHDVISIINTKTKRRLENQGIWVLKDRYLLDFLLKVFFKNSCYFRKYCPIISSVENITRRDCKMGHCSII